MLLVDAIHALNDDLVKVIRAPEWIGETIRATTDEQRTRATARLLAAAHNPYRYGPIRIHIRGNALAGFESHISYDYRDPFDDDPLTSGLGCPGAYGPSAPRPPPAKSARSKPKH